MANRPTDNQVSKYSDYLVDNYLTENCDYPPTLWASASSSLRRTTNNCESFRANFNKSFYKESPSINTLVNVLINEVQTEVYVKFRSTHLPNVAQDRKVRDRQNRNEQFITQYKNGYIDR